MKKLLTLTALGAILTAPATAVQKCVALDSSGFYTECEAMTTDSQIDVSAVCTTGDVDVLIKGVAICSNKSSDSGSLSETMTIDEENVNCWYKVVSPAVSPYIFVYSFATDVECVQQCNKEAAGLLEGDDSFRGVLFSNLSD